MLIISKSARVSPLAEIEDSVRGTRIVIEDGVVINSFVKIKPAGGSGDVLIGRNSYINSGTVIYTGNGVRIGEGVLIGANCSIAPVNHEFHDRGTRISSQGFAPSRGEIIIEDDVWIGVNTSILDGAVIRTGCVIGAMSLVNEQLEPFGIYAGNPLRKIGERQ